MTEIFIPEWIEQELLQICKDQLRGPLSQKQRQQMIQYLTEKH